MIIRERKKPVRNQDVDSENENIEASADVEEEKEDQEAMEMDENINKKGFATDSQICGVGDVFEEEEDIDLDDLEEVTEGVPFNVEIQDHQAAGLVPTQMIEVNFPLSQIISSSSLPSSTTTSTPPVSELSDQAHQEYQEICSFFQ